MISGIVDKDVLSSRLIKMKQNQIKAAEHRRRKRQRLQTAMPPQTCLVHMAQAGTDTPVTIPGCTDKNVTQRPAATMPAAGATQ